MTHNRTHLVAGGFTLLSLLGLLVSSVVLSGLGDVLRASDRFEVVFPIEVGAPGLSAGAAVTLGGQEIGRVTGVSFAEGEDGRPEGVLAAVRVSSGVRLLDDARVELVRPLVGAGAALNISDPGASGSLVDGETRLVGAMAAPSFLADAGFGDEQRGQLQRMLANAERATGSAETLMSSLETDVPAAAAELRRFLERSDSWAERVDGILTSVASASDTADGTVSRAERVVIELQGIVEENRQVLLEALASLNRSVAGIEEESVPEIREALRSARAAVETVERATGEAEAMLVGNRPSIERAVANVRLATDQLKLLSIEVRRTPWRALQRPTTRELREQLVYDAAQAYLLASVELAATGDTLAATVERGPGSRAEVEALRQRMAEAVEAYEARADELLERLEEGE